MKEKNIRVAMIQIPVKLGERKTNYETVERWFSKYYSPSETTTACVLPELWDVGYALDSVPALADREGEEAINFLSRLSKKYNCWFTGGSVMAEQNHNYYNRSLIVNPRGELVTLYDKTHLVPFITVEDGVFTHGDKPCLYEVDGIKCGSIICYDIRFPEWIRIYALKGAELLFICSQWTRSRMDLYRTMIRAHAIENMFYTVAVNNCDYSGDIDFGGGSFVSNPSGEVVAECSGTEDGLFATIDVTKLKENRDYLKVFEKRLPHLYGDLVN